MALIDHATRLSKDSVFANILDLQQRLQLKNLQQRVESLQN